MLHILLMILKIIGIVLAAIIGVLLIAVICALFVPVRYRVLADGKLGEEEPVWLEIKVTWLMHFINAAFTYSKDVRLKIRICCFTLFDSSKKDKGGFKKKKRKKKTREAPKEKDGDEEKAEPESPQMENAAIENAAVGNAAIEDKSQEKQEETVSVPTEDNLEEGNLEKEGKIKAFFRKLLEAIRNIEYTTRKICDKIKNVMENIRYYTDILQGETFQKAFQKVKKQLLWVLKLIKPRKCRISLMVGMEDPASTGQIMAVYGMLYPFIGNHVFIQADFEEKALEGDVLIKGKITAFIFCIVAVKLFVDKNIRKLVKLLKKEDV